MIRRPVTGLLLLSFILLFAGCEGDLPQGAIARVGDALVSQDEFEQLKAAYEAAGLAPDEDAQQDEYRRFEQGLAEYLVTLEVMQQEASSLKVSVAERDVQSELEQIERMFLTDEAFERALETQGLTLEQLTRSIRDRLWFDKAKAAVVGDVTVAEEEVQTYYEAHKGDYVEQESRDVRHILISPFATLAGGTVATTASDDEWEAARIEAEKVRSELQNGADFVTLVEKYSDDESTQELGGDLGSVTRGTMVPAFETAVFELEVGDLSQPVKTQYGYHIIEVTDITPEQQLSLDQVKEKIRTALIEEKQTEAWKQWLSLAQTRLGVEYLADYKPAVEQTVSSETTLNEADED